MPEKDKNQKKEENLNDKKIPEIELSEFRQCVELGTPFNGVVKDLWKIKYEPNSMVILHESNADSPTKEDFNWLTTNLTFGGSVLGGFSTLSFAEKISFSRQWSPVGWTDAKGNYRFTKELYRDVFDNKYVKGVEGIRNSNLIAKGKAIRISPASVITQSLSDAAGVICIVISVKDILDTKFTGNDLQAQGDFYDICFGGISFIPGIGWAITGLYVVADVISVTTTGKRIHEHWDNWFVDKYTKMQIAVENAVWRVIFNCLPHF